jgi:ubiquinone/menaquinone biosynthesis C-methylase UbiE
MSGNQSVWSGGDAYEPYVGRWSRLIAREFLDWLDVPLQSKWLDVGCGTGALSETILSVCEPSGITGVDPSEGYLDVARSQVNDRRVNFATGDARKLPVDDMTYDVVVSGLVLNFIPDIDAGIFEMRRAARN